MLDSSRNAFYYRHTCFGMRHVVCHGGKPAHPSATHTIVLRKRHRTRTGNWNSESLKGDARYAGLLFLIPPLCSEAFTMAMQAPSTASQIEIMSKILTQMSPYSNFKARRARGPRSCLVTRPSKD